MRVIVLFRILGVAGRLLFETILKVTEKLQTQKKELPPPKPLE